MSKHPGYVFAFVAALLALPSCTITPLRSPPDQNIEISKILDEVNSAVTRSIPIDPNFPALTSITLDLQVSVGGSAGATLPFSVVNIGSTLDAQKLHKVTVDFVPSATRQPSSLAGVTGEDGALTKAIRALYQSFANASPVYRLQRGQISLQCTFKASGTSGLKLVPVQANASINRQSMQTLTINFGRDPNRFVLPADQGTPRATSPTTTPTTAAVTPTTPIKSAAPAAPASSTSSGTTTINGE